MGENVPVDLRELMKSLVESNIEIKKQMVNNQIELKKEIRNIKEDIVDQLDSIKKENKDLKLENIKLKERIEKIEKTTKKYNIFIYNLREKTDKLEDINNFIATINTKTEVKFSFSDIRNYYRIGKKEENKTRPIAVEFLSYFLKEEILSKTSTLKQHKIYVSQDYTQKEYQDRKTLQKNLSVARKNNQEAYIKKGKLIVLGQEFTPEQLENCPLTEEKIQENYEVSEEEEVEGGEEEEEVEDRKKQEQNKKRKENPNTGTLENPIKKVLRNRNKENRKN